MTRQLQLHFGRHVHPVYREQLQAVPEGWSIVHRHPALEQRGVPPKRVVERSRRSTLLKERGEEVAMRLLSELGYVHVNRPRVLPGTELIHSGERLLWRSPVPYVVDLEHVSLFVLYQRAALERPWARAALERLFLDDRLRYLLPWSDAARRSVLACVSEASARQLEPKLITVPPAIRPAVAQPPSRRAKNLRLLFVGTVFLEKGGPEAVRAVQAAQTEVDVELDIVSYVPDAWQRRLADAEGIRVHVPGGAEIVQRLYERSDVLLFPSHMDTFGYVVLEAMAHGLPVLAPRHLALTETVEHGVSGLLFPPENMLYRSDTSLAFRHILPPPQRYLRALAEPSQHYIDAIIEQIVRVAKEPDLHSSLAAGALARVTDGPHSIERRRERLSGLYAAAAADAAMA